MSRVELRKYKCPNCYKISDIEVYTSVNNYHSELFAKILDKSIFNWKCPNCGKLNYQPYPIMFHKMGFKDVQICYKFPTSPIFSFCCIPDFLKNTGIDTAPIYESYDDIDEFVRRVSDFVTVFEDDNGQKHYF